MVKEYISFAPRTMVDLLLLFTTTLWIAFTVSHAQSMTEPNHNVDTLGGDSTFTEPPLLKNDAKSWGISMNVTMCEKTFGWLSLTRRCYNGHDLVGPTWKVKQGDTLHVVLDNQLENMQDLRKPINSLRFPNSTNLHTHGLHISSKDPQDNVLRVVPPEVTCTYTYQIHNENPPGTYWYHAHLHGSTAFQVHSGMAGMLIVEDKASDLEDIPELDAVSCPNNCDFEKQLVFQPLLQYTGRSAFGGLQKDIGDNELFRHESYIITAGGKYFNKPLSEWMGKELSYITVNGQLQPRMQIESGQMYRFRMVNAGGSNILELYIVDQSDNPACSIREIATDGIYLDIPRKMPGGQSLLVPGARVDWMVKCETTGNYSLKSYADPTNSVSIGDIERYSKTLLTIEVTRTVNTKMDFPTKLPSKPKFLRDLSNVDPSDIGGRFVVELSPKFHLNRELWSSETNYRYKMKKGSLQEWFLTNTDPKLSHPLHIHVNHFQIISYNEYTGPYGISDDSNWALYQLDDPSTVCHCQHPGYEKDSELKGNSSVEPLNHDQRYDANKTGYATVGDWLDVVLVPPLSNITIRFEAHEFTGDVIVHCHILRHEDGGMMMVTEIVEEGECTEAETASDGNYPGMCKIGDPYPYENETKFCKPDSGYKFGPTATILVAPLLSLGFYRMLSEHLVEK